jgi:uncharacterized protein YndB with AHSA1/START domain
MESPWMKTVLLGMLLTGLLVGAGLADSGPLEAEAVIDAPPARVWRAFTVPAEMEKWMVSHAEMDLRVGGLMRTHYSKDGVLGDPNTIENRILSLDPQRMLSIKVEKHPVNFPFKTAVKDMWTVVYFDPAGEGKTKVTVRGLGFNESEESQKMRAFFKAGNTYTLDELKKYVEATNERAAYVSGSSLSARSKTCSRRRPGSAR